MLKYLTRALFIVALLVLGLSIEALVRGERAADPAPSGNSVHSEKIVLIGGSIANGLAPRLRHFLGRISPDRPIEIVDFSSPLLTLDEADVRARRAIEQHRPVMVVFMLGLHEDVDDPNWLAEAREPLARGDMKSLVSLIVKGLDSDRPYQPYLFVMRNLHVLSRVAYRASLLRELKNETDAFARRAGDDANARRTALALLRLGVLITRGPPVPGRKQDEISKDFENHLKSRFAELTEWANEIRSLEYDRFVGTEADESSFMKTWFWLTWPRGARPADPIAHYTSHASDFLAVFHVPIHLSNQDAIDRVFEQPEYRRLLGAAVAQQKSKGYPRSQSLGPEFERRLAALFEHIAKNQIKPVLLHYPAIRLPVIDEWSTKFGVATAGGRSRLTDAVKESGRSPYFVDNILQTGHLSDAGLEIYGRDVAEDLVRLMR